LREYETVPQLNDEITVLSVNVYGVKEGEIFTDVIIAETEFVFQVVTVQGSIKLIVTVTVFV